MSTINISIRSNKPHAEVTKSGQRNVNVTKLINILSGMNVGAQIGEVYVSGSTAATLVAASATATLTYASLVNATDTLVLFGVTITCVTGTPAASDATTGQFKKQTDATVSAANLVTTINAHPTLVKYVSATSALGVVTITLNQKGSVGNFVAINTSAGTGIANVAYTAGAGGVESIPVQVR